MESACRGVDSGEIRASCLVSRRGYRRLPSLAAAVNLLKVEEALLPLPSYWAASSKSRFLVKGLAFSRTAFACCLRNSSFTSAPNRNNLRPLWLSTRPEGQTSLARRKNASAISYH